jgi:hypothetical protein
MKAHGMKGHTVTAAPKKRTGSLRLALPAPTDGAEYLMEVAFAGRAKRSKSKILSYRFRLPSSASSDVQTHGLGYYRANLYDGLSQTRTHLNQHFQKVDSYQPVD